MGKQMTWAEARDRLAKVYEDLDGAVARARDALLSPADEVPPGTEYRSAYADLLSDVTITMGQAEQLLEEVAESNAPIRPLETVLADIVAEGHVSVSTDTYGLGRWYCRSTLSHEGRTTAERESGEGEGATAIAAAEARLAQIRELREQQRAAVAALVQMLTPRWTVHESHDDCLPGWRVEGYDSQGIWCSWLHDDEDAARVSAMEGNRDWLLAGARERRAAAASKGASQ